MTFLPTELQLRLAQSYGGENRGMREAESFSKLNSYILPLLTGSFQWTMLNYGL